MISESERIMLVRIQEALDSELIPASSLLEAVGLFLDRTDDQVGAREGLVQYLRGLEVLAADEAKAKRKIVRLGP